MIQTEHRVAALGATLLLGLAAPQLGGYHEDPRCGFKIKPPKAWQAIPLQLDETRQVAKFLSKREYTWTDQSGRGWSYEHRAQMVAVALSPENDEQVEAAPYELYEAYLERVRGSDADVIARERGALGDIPVTKLSVAVRRGGFGGTLRLSTWIYELEELDLAIEFEFLGDHEDKLRRTLESSFKSLRTIARSGPLPGAGPAEVGPRTYAQLALLEPAARRARRMELEHALHAKARATLPEDWSAEDRGRFLVLNHSDDRAAERMTERGNAVLDFLDRRFPYLGPDEYVRRPILRICKDWEEERTFRRGGDGWSYEAHEIVTYDDNLGSVDSYKAESMNRRVVSLWLRERDYVLSMHMPSWLRWGFENAFANAVPKRKKLDFRRDDWDRKALRELVREERATLPRELVLLGRKDFFGGEFWDRQREAGALVRFLLSDGAAKNAKTRDVLDDYLRNLVLVAERIEAAKPKPDPEEEEDEEPSGKEEEQPKLTDEERKALAKAAEETRAAEERKILNEVFERTFQSWSDRDWDAFEKVYFKSLK